MMLKNILLLGLSGLVFSGCVVTGAALKGHNMSNRFTVNKNYINVATLTQEMMKNCEGGIYKNQKNIFKSIKKAAVNMTDGNKTFYYYHVDIESTEENKSNVIIYSYFNNEETRKVSRTIENWLVNDSKECVQGL